MPDLNVITRTRDEARATLRQIADRLADPCARCPDAALCTEHGCPSAPSFSCPDQGCEFTADCEAGALCAMLRPELTARDDSQYAEEARDMAEIWAVRKTT